MVWVLSHGPAYSEPAPRKPAQWAPELQGSESSSPIQTVCAPDVSLQLAGVPGVTAHRQTSHCVLCSAQLLVQPRQLRHDDQRESSVASSTCFPHSLSRRLRIPSPSFYFILEVGGGDQGWKWCEYIWKNYVEK